jgi:hypothetical protein
MEMLSNLTEPKHQAHKFVLRVDIKKLSDNVIITISTITDGDRDHLHKSTFWRFGTHIAKQKTLMCKRFLRKKFLEKLMAYLPFVLHGPHRKRKKLKGINRCTESQMAW